MRALVIILLVAGGVFGVSRYGSSIYSRLPTPIASRLPVRQVAERVSSESGTVNVDDKVLGVSTSIGQAGKKLEGLSGIAVNAVSGAVTILSSTPTSSTDVIDVSKVAASVAQSVEGIPSNFAQQAKIEYCRQVLEQATKSATPN